MLAKMVKRGIEVRLIHEKEPSRFDYNRINQNISLQFDYGLWGWMPTTETRKREFGALLDIPDNHPKFVLSLDPVDMSTDGITHLNLREFLKHEPE